MNNKEKFREELLSQEQTNPEHQKNFQLETKKMYTEKLKKRQRFMCVLFSLLIGIFAIIFWVLSKMFEEMQIDQGVNQIESLRLATTWAMFLCMVLIILLLWPAIRGKVGLRFYPSIIRFIFWVLVMVIALLTYSAFSYVGRELDDLTVGSAIEMTGVVAIGILLVIMGTNMVLGARMDGGDLKNKAKMLELEYRIAELEKKLNQSK